MAILDAITVLRTAVYAALAPLAAPSGVHWLTAGEDATLPAVIFQSQDAGGRQDARVGATAWSGLVTVKALATTQGTAETLLAAVLPGLSNLSASGFVFQARPQRPLVLPPSGGTWQAGYIYRVHIEET